MVIEKKTNKDFFLFILGYSCSVNNEAIYV